MFPETVRKLAHVPLFIKRAFQKRGRTSDRNVETIDLLPTLADVVGIDLPWPVDGVTVFSKAPARSQKTVYRRLEPMVIDGALPATRPELERKRAWFGPEFSWEGCFAPGGGRRWLGVSVGELDLLPGGRGPPASFSIVRVPSRASISRQLAFPAMSSGGCAASSHWSASWSP